jgi:hypothetical protein
LSRDSVISSVFGFKRVKALRTVPELSWPLCPCVSACVYVHVAIHVLTTHSPESAHAQTRTCARCSPGRDECQRRRRPLLDRITPASIAKRTYIWYITHVQQYLGRLQHILCACNAAICMSLLLQRAMKIYVSSPKRLIPCRDRPAARHGRVDTARTHTRTQACCRCSARCATVTADADAAAAVCASSRCCCRRTCNVCAQR